MYRAMSDTTDKRLERLEESLAHSEMTIGHLSDELAKQWQVIDRQNRIISEIREKVDGLEADQPDAPEAHQPPPHY